VTERSALLGWYDRVRRELPWRRNREPWPVWVSEVMLQQTRVETATPYFERFLVRFPSPAALAAAPIEDALAHWSGLGYYRRIRQLHAAARQVVAAGGAIPSSAGELERLPGVGPYTAAAIASIAFGEPTPVLDGNVARVIARRGAIADDPARPAVRRRLLAAAAELIDPARPGDSNQALMELGATLCTPRAPRCADCPLAAGCRARELGASERIPPPRRRPAGRATSWSSAIVRDRHGRLLLVRRPEDAEILPGLWEPPTLTGARPEPAEFAARFGGEWRFAAEPLARLRHTVTFRRIALGAWAADWLAGEIAEGDDRRWSEPAAALGLPLTGAARKLLARLAAGAG
jgi:A/G-specific adenine glycosylase